MRPSFVAAVSLIFVVGCQCGPGPGPDAGVALPSGFSQVLEGGANDGKMLSLVLDDSGLPLIAYMNETSPSQWGVFFTRFDGASAKWTTPVSVAANLGIISDNPTRQALWLARDPMDGRLGIAFTKYEQFCVGPNSETTIHVTLSTDDGKTWSASDRVSEAHYTRNDPVNGVEVCNTQQPRIAMKNGTVHVAWAASAGEVESITNYFRGYYYASSTTPGTWARTLLGHAGDDARQGTSGIVSLALDANGAPAVAWVMGAISLHPTAPRQTAVLYGRPGSAPVRVADSNNVQNDEPQIALAFDGTQPRIAAHLVRTSGLAGANGNWVFASSDGAAFTAAQVPDDAEDEGGRYIDLEFDRGNGAMLFSFESSGARGACGGPKLARSSDAAATWTICGLDTQTHQFLGEYVTAELNAAGKIVAAFREDTADSAGRFKAGIVLYVEP